MTKQTYFDGTTTSRADELKAVHELAKQFRIGSFMFDFFTLDLREWLEAKAAAGERPDIMQELNDVKARYKKYFDAAEETIARIDTENAKRAIDAQVTSRNGTIEFWAAKARENGIALSAKEIEAEQLKRQVNDLKAKLYDLIEGRGTA